MKVYVADPRTGEQVFVGAVAAQGGERLVLDANAISWALKKLSMRQNQIEAIGERFKENTVPLRNAKPILTVVQ